jgi:hypothetical protein
MVKRQLKRETHERRDRREKSRDRNLYSRRISPYKFQHGIKKIYEERERR